MTLRLFTPVPCFRPSAFECRRGRTRVFTNNATSLGRTGAKIENRLSVILNRYQVKDIDPNSDDYKFAEISEVVVTWRSIFGSTYSINGRKDAAIGYDRNLLCTPTIADRRSISQWDFHRGENKGGTRGSKLDPWQRLVSKVCW